MTDVSAYNGTTYNPNKLTAQELKDAALKLANEIRQQMGYPPVDHLYPGTIANAMSCPITNTIIDDDVTGWSVETGTGRVLCTNAEGKIVKQYHDPASRSFVLLFDAGVFPELVKND